MDLETALLIKILLEIAIRLLEGKPITPEEQIIVTAAIEAVHKKVQETP